MAEMTYLVTAEEKCEVCNGRGTIRHPVAQLFDRDMQSGKTIAEYFQYFDLPLGTEAWATCPACDGRGHFKRTVVLDDALADLARQ